MFVKALVRTAVITGLVGGAAVVVAGPERVGCLISQTRGAINNQIDKAIDDPIALRSQIRSLEQQYPERIAEVRSDLAELRQQVSQIKQEQEVSERVVALADRDLNQMQGLLAKAQDAQADGAIVRVVFNNEPVNLDDAYAKATRMQQVKLAHETRLADSERNLGKMAEQETRLTELLSQLETEHASFQTQLWQLDCEIDAIARNERMLSTMEKRNESIGRHSRYEAASLEQLSARFAEIRAKQEARLEAIGSTRQMTNYENRARLELDAKSFGTKKTNSEVFIRPRVIEITPDSVVVPQVGPSTGPAMGEIEIQVEAPAKTSGIASRAH